MQDDWPDYRLDFLEKGEHFSLCRKRISGQTGLVKNEHIGRDAQGSYYRTSSNSHFLSVRKGDGLALLDGTCSGYLYVMDREGYLGWIPRGAAEPELSASACTKKKKHEIFTRGLPLLNYRGVIRGRNPL